MNLILAEMLRAVGVLLLAGRRDILAQLGKGFDYCRISYIATRAADTQILKIKRREQTSFQKGGGIGVFSKFPKKRELG